MRTPYHQINEGPAPHKGWDCLERWWLRWNRSRARGIMEHHEWEARQEQGRAVEARGIYQWWIDQERRRGFDWRYDDTDVTWKFELFVYGGIVVLMIVGITLLWVLKH